MQRPLDFTRPHVLRSEEEYAAALAEIEELMGRELEPGSEDDDRLEFLSLLVEDYEDRHVSLGQLGTPQSAVDFMLEQKGMTRRDLHDAMGGKARVSEFFAEKRKLSRSQIEALRDLLGIPADLLL